MMVFKVGFGVMLLFVTVHGQHDHEHHNHHKVNVDVYYESLCPDSKKFITQQLYPAIKTNNLSPYINLTLVPYGKSTSKFEISSYEFMCHHGPNECLGNKIHACAIRRMGNMEDGLDVNTVGFVSCLMDNSPKDGSSFPTKECAEMNHVGNWMDIDNCANHTDGSNYLATLGQKTMDVLKRPLESVPTIVFNGHYKKEDSDLAQTSFVRAVCNYIEGTKPEVCANAPSGGLNVQISPWMVSTVLAGILMRY